MAESRKYTADEVHEILRRAAEKTAARASADDGLEHDALVAAAREAGLDPAAVEQAAAELDESRSLDAARRELVTEKRQGFFSHLSAYAIVNIALVLLAVFVTGKPYSLVVAIGWGIGLAFHLLSALRAPTDRDVERFQKERRAEQEALDRALAKTDARRKSREEKERRRADERAKSESKQREKEARKEKIREASEALETAVEKGVAAALEAAASTIESMAKPAAPTNAPTDFSRYVDDKKRGSAAPTTSTSNAPTNTTSNATGATGATGVRIEVRPVDAAAAPDERDAQQNEDRASVARTNKRT